EVRRIAAEGAVHQIPNQSALGAPFRSRGPIDVRSALPILPLGETLTDHDLEQFQHRGVADLIPAVERIEHLAAGAGSPGPEDPENLELAGGRLGRCGTGHVRSKWIG